MKEKVFDVGDNLVTEGQECHEAWCSGFKTKANEELRAYLG